MMTRIIFLILVPLFLVACGPKSLQDYREEGENVTQELIEKLETIKTREDLIKATTKLRHLFEKLSQIIISAREFREKNPDAELEPLSKRNKDLSEKLRQELNRIYSMDDGSDIIERCQTEALNRLDATEKKRKIYNEARSKIN